MTLKVGQVVYVAAVPKIEGRITESGYRREGKVRGVPLKPTVPVYKVGLYGWFKESELVARDTSSA